MDTITLKSLKISGNHGYYDDERENGNDFEVDVSASGEFKKSIEKDDLSQSFNYELAEQVVVEVIKGPSEKLIEKLCFEIGEKLFAKAENVNEMSVTVRKLNPPLKTPTAYAEITMQWKR